MAKTAKIKLMTQVRIYWLLFPNLCFVFSDLSFEVVKEGRISIIFCKC